MLSAVSSLWEELLAIGDFLVDNNFENLLGADNIVRKLSQFDQANTTVLMDAQLKKVWPYKGTPDDNVDITSQTEYDVVVYEAVVKDERVSRQQLNGLSVGTLFMDSRYSSTPSSVVIYSRGDHLLRSVSQIPNYHRTRVLIIECDRSERGIVENYLVDEVGFQRDYIYRSTKSVTEGRSSSGVRRQTIENGIARGYVYHTSGSSGKPTSFWSAPGTPSNSLSSEYYRGYIKEFLSAGVTREKIVSLTYAAAAGQITESDAYEIVPGIPQHMFVGIGFKQYNALICSRPSNSGEDDKRVRSVSPQHISELVLMLRRLHKLVFGGELVVVGISNQDAKIWDSLEFDAVDYAYLLLTCLQRACRMSYYMDHICGLHNNQWTSPVRYITQDLSKLAPHSLLRKQVSNLQAHYDTVTDPMLYHGLHTYVQDLHKKMKELNARLVAGAAMYDMDALGRSQVDEEVWTDAGYRKLAAQLVKCYPLLDALEGCSLSTWLSGSKDDSELDPIVMEYIRGIDALRHKERTTTSRKSTSANVRSKLVG
jgi:hypothetical protein